MVYITLNLKSSKTNEGKCTEIHYLLIIIFYIIISQVQYIIREIVQKRLN